MAVQPGSGSVEFSSIGEGVQGVAWFNDSYALAARTGNAHLFEMRGGTGHSYSRTKIVDLANASGTCIVFSNDGKEIFIGTSEGIIQFDLEINQGQSIDVSGVVSIEVANGTLLVLTQKTLLSVVITKIKAEIDKVQFKQVKVALLGHTGVGKSTLCSKITTGDKGDEKSTFGRKVWTWIPDSSDRRIIFHDYGGQEAVITTFIPFIHDADIVLILFKKTDRASLDRAVKMLAEVRNIVQKQIPIIFVETHIDHEMDETRAGYALTEYLADGRINAHVKVDATKGSTDVDVQTAILSRINWDESSIVIRSKMASIIRRIIEEKHRNREKSCSLRNLAEEYHRITDEQITGAHLGFILKSLSDEGVVEYFPDIADYVVINDPDFSHLRSTIPIVAASKGGLVSIRDIEKEFHDNLEFVRILDEIYTQNDFSIRFEEQRVYPSLLKDYNIDLGTAIITELEKNMIRYESSFNPMERDLFLLLKSLSNLEIRCIELSQNEGLFETRQHSYLFYETQPKRVDLKKVVQVFRWTVGGANGEDCKRTNRIFESILESVFGPPIDTPVRHMIQKGETDRVEFKQSINSSYKIARSISAFGNTDGGNLIIGVDITGKTLGIESSYQNVNPFGKDGFELKIKEILKANTDLPHSLIMTTRFEIVDNHDVCHIIVAPSEKPIWMQKGENQKKDIHLVIRDGNGTRRLDGQDAVDYVNKHWPRK